MSQKCNKNRSDCIHVNIISDYPREVTQNKNIEISVQKCYIPILSIILGNKLNFELLQCHFTTKCTSETQINDFFCFLGENLAFQG